MKKDMKRFIREKIDLDIAIEENCETIDRMLDDSEDPVEVNLIEDLVEKMMEVSESMGRLLVFYRKDGRF